MILSKQQKDFHGVSMSSECTSTNYEYERGGNSIDSSMVEYYAKMRSTRTFDEHATMVLFTVLFAVLFLVLQSEKK